MSKEAGACVSEEPLSWSRRMATKFEPPGSRIHVFSWQIAKSTCDATYGLVSRRLRRASIERTSIARPEMCATVQSGQIVLSRNTSV